MRFADPWMFLFLILLIPVIFFHHRKGGRIRFSNLLILKNASSSSGKGVYIVPVLLRSLVLILVITALARPQSGKKFSEVSSEGVDIILALDTSGSMEALDFKLNGKPATRLDVVKKVVSGFIQKRKSDRLGMVVFGAEAYTQCPLTLDHGVLLKFLDSIHIGMAGDATAIGSAIGIGVKRLKDIKAKAKVIILLTDGRNNAGRLPPEKAAEIASRYGIKVYTIGTGTKGPAPFLIDTVFGKRYIERNVDLDEETLKKVAVITDARYFRASNEKKLEKIYNEIDHLEKSRVKVKEYSVYEEMFQPLVLYGFMLLLVEILISHTWLERIP